MTGGSGARGKLLQTGPAPQELWPFHRSKYYGQKVGGQSLKNSACIAANALDPIPPEQVLWPKRRGSERLNFFGYSTCGGGLVCTDVSQHSGCMRVPHVPYSNSFPDPGATAHRERTLLLAGRSLDQLEALRRSTFRHGVHSRECYGHGNFWPLTPLFCP